MVILSILYREVTNSQKIINMELIIHILMLFILLNTALKLSFWDKKILWGMSILLGSFTMFVYPYAIEQSQTQIEEFLQSSKILGNMAVLVSLEAVMCMAFCFLALSHLYQQNKSSKWLKVLNYYPCLLIFPVIFYGLTQTMFIFTGVDFFMTAIVFSIVLSLALPLFSYGVKIFIPEQDLRLEIHFFMSLLITILGLISTANGRVIYTAQSSDTNFQILGLTLMGFLSLFGVGFFLNKFWWNYQSRKNKL